MFAFTVGCMPLRVLITTILDVLALLLVAAGFAVALWPVSGGLGLGVAGATVAVGSAFAASPAGRRP